MLGPILNRLAFGIFTLWVVSLLVFLGSEILPGDAAQAFLGQYATEETVRALRVELGLDRPLAERYLSWLWGAVQGDWGTSLTTRVPVAQMLSERLGNTALLAGLTALVSVPTAIILGLLMALGSGGAFDRVTSIVVLCLSAIPEFLIATLAVLAFAVHLRWLPSIAHISPGEDFLEVLRSLVLPAGALSAVLIAQIARMTRATITNLLGAPFIEMAMLKGAPNLRIIAVHGLVNVVGPLANVVALNLAYLISGVVVVETIFAFPGLARLMVDAVSARDLPVIQACAMLFCLAYILLIFAADILAILFNPRQRRSLGRGPLT